MSQAVSHYVAVGSTADVPIALSPLGLNHHRIFVYRAVGQNEKKKKKIFKKNAPTASEIADTP